LDDFPLVAGIPPIDQDFCLQSIPIIIQLRELFKIGNVVQFVQIVLSLSGLELIENFVQI
jgi:hypothetical protein